MSVYLNKAGKKMGIGMGEILGQDKVIFGLFRLKSMGADISRPHSWFAEIQGKIFTK